MSDNCVIDLETRSFLDVRKVGAVKYFEHETTEVECMGWKLPGQKRRMWREGDPFPAEIVAHVEKGGTLEAHNAMFECAGFLYLFYRKHKMIPRMPTKWCDTMAACAYRALPMALDAVGDVLNLAIKKNKYGKYLLQKLTKPRKALKREVKAWQAEHGDEPMPLLWHDKNAPIPLEWLDNKDPTQCLPWWTKDTTLYEALCDYCGIDVDSEDLLGHRIGELPPDEYRLWVLDQKINWRGVQVDMDAVYAALEIVASVEQTLNAEIARITDDAVKKGTEVAKIKEWALSQLFPQSLPVIHAEQNKQKRALLVKQALYDMHAETGLNLLSLAKDQVEEALSDGEDGDEDKYGFEDDYEDEDDLDADQLDMELIGGAGAKLVETTPWQKVKRILQIRQQTSRSSTKKLKKILECVCADGRLRGLLQYYGASTGRWSGRLAQPHNFPRGNAKILKNGIEALVAAIKTRDPELLALFYGDPMDAIASALRGMFIAGPGKTLRVADFSQIEARVTMWLAGADQALEAFALSDRGEGPDIYCFMAMKLYRRPINKKDNPEERQLGKITILGCGYQMGAEKLLFQAWKDYRVRLTLEQAEFLVNGYREAYPQVKALWYGLERAAINAVENPGESFAYSAITYCTEDDDAGHWLTAQLPNGRKLWYFNPDVTEVHLTNRQGEPYTKKQLGYRGRDNKKGGIWSYIRTYGGMLVENVVQAISRDIMAEAMVRVEVAGYPIILTVHDEVVSECVPEHGSQKEFETLMKGIPYWLPDCPINVEGWSGPRYKKA